jgi:hypothetical protein
MTNPHPELTEAFAHARPRLLRLAYSQLGSLEDAQDVVQDAWLRLDRAGADAIEDLEAWLTTVVARLSLGLLRSARSRRERYVGPWLPEPLLDGTGEGVNPAERVTLDESVSFALLAAPPARVTRTGRPSRPCADRARACATSRSRQTRSRRRPAPAQGHERTRYRRVRSRRDVLGRRL